MPKRMNGIVHSDLAKLAATLDEPRQLKFLANIWTRHTAGFVFLAARTGRQQWIERAFAHDAFDEIARFLLAHPADSHDLYFCPNAFCDVARIGANALRTPFAWCDIDDARPKSFEPQPTILIQTSPGRFQGIWEFFQHADRGVAEGMSRYLAYRFGGDRNGWSVTKFLRLPFSYNHKPGYDKPRVNLLHRRTVAISDWSDVDPYRSHSEDQRTLVECDPSAHDADAVIAKFRKSVRPRYHRLMKERVVRSHDRSRCVFMIVASLHNAGATTEEIAAVVWASPYFIEKFGPNRRRLNIELGRILSKLRNKP
ncbi:MAG: DNA-primase RepB domain-containing protein [Rhodoblastus sp.]